MKVACSAIYNTDLIFTASVKNTEYSSGEIHSKIEIWDITFLLYFSDDCFLSVKFKKLISTIDFSFKIKDNLKKHSL